MHGLYAWMIMRYRPTLADVPNRHCLLRSVPYVPVASNKEPQRPEAFLIARILEDNAGENFGQAP